MNINDRYIVSFSPYAYFRGRLFCTGYVYGMFSLSTCFAYYNQKLALDGFEYFLGYFKPYRFSIRLFKIERIIGNLIVRTPKLK